jgi:hypothetical protein
MNHKWQDNTCIHCGIKRERKTWRLLMAIVNHPPYNAYKYGTGWHYGEPYKFNRPDCKTRQIKQ